PQTRLGGAGVSDGAGELRGLLLGRLEEGAGGAAVDHQARLIHYIIGGIFEIPPEGGVYGIRYTDYGDPSMAEAALSPIRRTTSLTKEVVDRLRKAILSGELAEGLSLPEALTATKLGVSRVPVREALV